MRVAEFRVDKIWYSKILLVSHAGQFIQDRLINKASRGRAWQPDSLTAWHIDNFKFRGHRKISNRNFLSRSYQVEVEVKKLGGGGIVV